MLGHSKRFSSRFTTSPMETTLCCALSHVDYQTMGTPASPTVARLPAFQHLVTGELLQHVNRQSLFGSRDANLTTELAVVLHRLAFNNTSVSTVAASPLGFLQALCEKHGDFRIGVQADAVECVERVIDTVLEDINQVKSDVRTKSWALGGKQFVLAKNLKNRHDNNEPTIVMEIKCTGCSSKYLTPPQERGRGAREQKVSCRTCNKRYRVPFLKERVLRGRSTKRADRRSHSRKGKSSRAL